MGGLFRLINMRCIALRCVALRCVASRRVALHCVVLRCVALHCIAYQFYEKFINTPLEERNYNIPIYYNISNNEEVNLWLINVIQYSANVN